VSRRAVAIVLALAALLGGTPALAQPGVPAAPVKIEQPGRTSPLAPPAPVVGSPVPALTPPNLNPVEIMASAGELLPQSKGGTGEGEKPRGLSTVMSIMLLLTVIALAPSIILMTTCFVRIAVVLALLRQAIGTQNLPPPQVTIALSLFMTMLVMAPTVERIQTEALAPYQAGQIAGYTELWNKAKQPIRDFMFDQLEATGNWSSLYMVLEYRGVDISAPEKLRRADVDMIALIPAFMLSELKTSFLMGFKIYLPFLVIDMVISTMLISMSMMMLPPVLVSLPFKLLLFVLVDGWTLVVGGLMHSFATAPGAVALAPALGAIGGGA
jgi:flagellar biosynthetic protein FliP